ncbi:DsrE family protein [Oceanihabitans sediminis]|uniref:Sulfur reduction protein DsrE n=1 Tax=Oceanihabitans sediminis TaxID=1812012 RepID=A0A368P8D2_9FLAO|nr:DsrE family protein [Oceanihabitans sediminis]MDX1277644.1 DsrE family protein [Oceanihabitans sediminis]MDX1773902.1 DsrE family protein [Oceanihabitans sediminis]RBP32072.1 intracellular sulfur oxidation DsrE/DsrF family protein [Oceanihabitans sediminis]RCU58726.1 sulfur reduction protein DsrE [Oceanihabitans sediminis]
MKKYIFSFLFLITLFASANLKAQEVDFNKNNYVVLTKKVPQLQPIILAAEALKAEDGDSFGDFQVVICGKEIGAITDKEIMRKHIKRAQNVGVKLIACGFSLNKFNVDKSKVPTELKIIENGILHNLQLQKQGYKSITL